MIDISWVYGATLECGHEIAGEVPGGKAFVTPYELDDVVYCPHCKAPSIVYLTWGRGR